MLSELDADPCVERGAEQPLMSTTEPNLVKIDFLEGAHTLSEETLRRHDITQHHVTSFYREQIRKSGYYHQLKYIVEPSVMEFSSNGSLDTSGEHDNTVVTGLQHKYPQTGLLLVTDRCASYCRYCFRKRIVGNDSDEITPDYALVARYIMQHPEMTNVLLSGGDAFVLSTRKLNQILDYLLPIPHLTSIRFGTKTVAFAPKRFEDVELSPMFRRIHDAGKTAVVVAHFDHIGEISQEAEFSIRRMRAEGVQFLNQAVLLAKVNDDPDILATTFAKCHEIGVRPYYLFQGRPVKAASHFQVPLRRGVEIVEGINRCLSGIQKTFKYIMSHYTGKIEILGLSEDDRLYMRYHQSKRPDRVGKIFSRSCSGDAYWLDDLSEE
jgi:KamA family protein